MTRFIRNIIIVFTLLFSQSSFAQLLQVGMAYNGMFFKGQSLRSHDPGSYSGSVYTMEEVDDKNHLLGLSLFYYHPLVKMHSEFTFGPQIGATVSGSYQQEGNYMNSNGVSGYVQGSPLVFTTKFPTTAMLRFGALASKNSKANFGGAVGFGTMMVNFLHPVQKGTYFPLILTTELNYEDAGFRIDIPFSSFSSVYQSETGDIPKVKMSLISLNFTYAFP